MENADEVYDDEESAGIQARIMNANNGYGWTASGTGGGMNFPQPSTTVPYPAGEHAFGFHQPIPGGASGGGGLYPNIGFNPNLLGSTGDPRHMACPICQNILSPPIYQCEKGHVICNTCIDRLDYCPQNQCMDPLEGPKIRNLVLEQAYQGWGVKCPNAGQGCPVLLSGQHLTNHLEVCEYRGFLFCSKYLGITTCSDRVTRSSLLNHLGESHQVDTTEHQQFLLKLIAPSQLFEPSSGSRGIIWKSLAIQSPNNGDSVLLKCVVTPRGYLSMAGYLLASHSETEWKRYRIQFQITSTRKVARLEWTGGLINHDFNNTTNSSGVVISNVNTFRIPVETLQEYIQPSNFHQDQAASKIKIKVSVWKNEDDAFPFRNHADPDGDDSSLEKLTLFNEFPGHDDSTYSFTMEEQESNYFQPNTSHVTSTRAMGYDQEEYAKYYSLDSNCSNCTRPLYGDVIYQCLQCPSESTAIYFCRNCIEGGNNHDHHLTVRIPKPELQPLAAVAYECSAGELH